MTTAKSPAIAPEAAPPYRLALNIRAIDLTKDQFLCLCSDNGDLRLELTAEGELIIMPPAGGESAWQEHELALQVGIWAKQDGTGRVFSPSAGFDLPNGAVRAPDVSWILLSRWESLSRDEQRTFSPICPDFVIELRSPSDRLGEAQRKMAEYLENGVRLGWLIDPQNKRIYVYRPGQPVEILEEPDTISGDPVLPGFALDLSPIWQARPS